MLVIVLLVVIVIGSGWWLFWDLVVIDFQQWLLLLGVVYWFGIDYFGWDIFLCLLVVICVLLGVVMVCLLLVLLIGLVVGGCVGLLGGCVDCGLMCIVELFMIFLILILLFFMVGVLGIGLINVIFVIVLLYWVWYVRMVCNLVVFLCQCEFIFVVCLSGVSQWWLFSDYLVGVVIFLLLVFVLLDIGYMMFYVVGMLFFGFGVSVLMVEWGVMINDVWQYIWIQLL